MTQQGNDHAETILKLLQKRAEELKVTIKRVEEMQKVTSDIWNFTFDY